jgi:uncharacterized cupredoxin-like copper-binding protein
MTSTRRNGIVASMTALVLLLSACGDATPTAQESDPTEVSVTLNEFGIAMSRTAFDSNVDYTFTVTNAGAAAHEFMILPPISGEGMDMEMMDEMAVAVIAADDLPAGATVTRTFRLPAGSTLEAACHVEGHYEAGMKQSITVTE